MKTIHRIFVNLPFNPLVELRVEDFIFSEPAYTWINYNKIEDYSFLDVTHDGIEYKLPTSDFKFIY